ncbi:MAG: trehalose-6-phosphate synthase, partial [Holophagales bacterium]|nr:trehalose-6-phosphate synthase [Holophagales bacterium]
MASQNLPAAQQSELVIVANTLPVRREEVDGELRWTQSPGGLVSALSPIVREAGGCWVGWTGGADDAPEPFRHEDILNVAVPVSEAEFAGSYQGMCNSTLWPLYHDAVRPPEYHRHWWNPYVAVNRRFAEEAARRTAPGGRVWIQDYHLQLVPRMLRELRPDISSGFFLHIPFPPIELFLRLPWRRALLEGLLGADVVGFQTQAGADNFTRLADRLIEAEPQGETIRYQ